MKQSHSITLGATALLLGLAATAQATVVDFDAVTAEVNLTVQYSGLGVHFSALENDLAANAVVKNSLTGSRRPARRMSGPTAASLPRLIAGARGRTSFASSSIHPSATFPGCSHRSVRSAQRSRPSIRATSCCSPYPPRTRSAMQRLVSRRRASRVSTSSRTTTTGATRSMTCLSKRRRSQSPPPSRFWELASWPCVLVAAAARSLHLPT